MHSRFFALGVLLTLCTTLASAQSKPPTPQALQRARQEVRLADGLVAIDQDYRKALRLYLKAQELFPKETDLYLKAADCLMQQGQYAQALTQLQQALRLQPSAGTAFRAARAAHLDAQWETAQGLYAQVDSLPQASEALRTQAQRMLAQCRFGQQQARQPSEALVSSLGKRINSADDEYGPVLSPDGSQLYFTSRRSSATGVFQDEDGQSFSDIYLSSRRKGESEWMRYSQLKGEFNTKGHDALVGISKSGKTLLMYRGERGGDLYYIRKVRPKKNKPEVLMPPQKLPSPINSPHREASACFSADGNLLYFTSDRPGGQGGMDIYVSRRKGEDWEQPENLQVLNTPYDEEGLCLSPDGKTLYFSSRGHEGMGGFDLFRSTLEGNRWSKPENLGYPINTPHDELFPAFHEEVLYYSSNQPGNEGGMDLMTAHQLRAGRKPLLEADSALIARTAGIDLGRIYQQGFYTLSLGLLQGRVSNAEGKPLAAEVLLTDNRSGEVLAQQPTEADGSFGLALPLDSNLGLTVRATGYLFYSENLRLQQATQLERSIRLQPVKQGGAIVLNNIFYKADSYELSPESKAELQQLVTVMQENPSMAVEISGHTDNTGTRIRNESLSHQRAKSVVDYLAEAGVNRQRLRYQGYADTRPVASNKTEEGRQRNRRTELKVVRTQ